MKVRTRFILLFSFICLSMIVILIGMILLLKNQEDIHVSEKGRYYSYKFGDELRQSSDDLTEYCINYVITGDTVWENLYWQVINERKGKAINEFDINQSLSDSMAHMDFTLEEFDLLNIALEKSNQLVWVETIAFNAVKGNYLDSANQFTIHKEPDIEYALGLLHNQDYLLMKTEIMEPITRFEGLIESRTKAQTELYVKKGRFFFVVTIFLILLIIIVAIIGYFIINKRLRLEENIMYNLNKRVKEQACLHKISQLTENTDHSLEHVLQSAVLALPYAWKYPNKVHAKIVFNGHSYTSINYTETQWVEKVIIKENTKELGYIEVYYQEQRLELQGEAFYIEEKNLIVSVATLLSTHYERRAYQEDILAINSKLRTEIAESLVKENNLKRSELEFKTLVNNLPGTVYKYIPTDPWEMIFITNEIETLTGYPKETFLGKNPKKLISDLIHPSDKQQSIEKVLLAINLKKPYNLEYRTIHKNGQVRHVYAYGQAIYKADGSPDFIVGGIFDDSERLTAIKKVKESEERFQLAAKGSNAGIWDLDVKSGTAYWTEIHYNLLGYSIGEIEPTLDFVKNSVLEADLKIFDEAVNNHINLGTPLDFEARYYKKNKDIRWFRARGASSRDKNGKSLRIVGTFADITDKKEAENALAAKEQQLQYALDVSNEGIWEWNIGTNELTYSIRCFSMVGSLPIKGKKELSEFWNSVIHKDDAHKALINNLEGVKKSGLFNKIYRVVTNSNQIKWIHTKGKAVEFLEDGKPSRVIGTMSDITDRMKQEEKIVSAILETEDKERSRIARDIHDGLQQTMTTSLMSFEKVRSSTDFKDQAVYDKFHMGYTYLKKSIEESRTLAHNLMPKVVDKNGLVAAIKSLLSAIENSTDTEFVFDENINKTRLKLSEEMTFYRIIQEALNNVIKYANAKTCNIQLIKHSDVVVLTIEDNGVGFDFKNNINTFGINSMKTRADSIGAFFEINSRPEKGTQIFLELPLK